MTAMIMMTMNLISAAHTSENSKYKDLEYLETTYPCNIYLAAFAYITQVATAVIK
jgi:hypothetical protein